MNQSLKSHDLDKINGPSIKFINSHVASMYSKPPTRVTGVPILDHNDVLSLIAIVYNYTAVQCN